MDNQLNRYYRKVRTLLKIDPKTIHQERVTALGLSALSYTTLTNVFVKEEKMSMIILDLLVHYSNLQVEILNWLDRLSTMIHVQLVMKL